MDTKTLLEAQYLTKNDINPLTPPTIIKYDRRVIKHLGIINLTKFFT